MKFLKSIIAYCLDKLPFVSRRAYEHEKAKSNAHDGMRRLAVEELSVAITQARLNKYSMESKDARIKGFEEGAANSAKFVETMLLKLVELETKLFNANSMLTAFRNTSKRQAALRAGYEAAKRKKPVAKKRKAVRA